MGFQCKYKTCCFKTTKTVEYSLLFWTTEKHSLKQLLLLRTVLLARKNKDNHIGLFLLTTPPHHHHHLKNTIYLYNV